MGKKAVEITLKFTVDNNYGRMSKDKYLDENDPIINACWVVNCAMAAIENSYSINAPRRIEMEKLHRNLLHQIKKQLTPAQYEATQKRFRILEELPPITTEK